MAAMPTSLPAPVPRLSITAVSQLPPIVSPIDARRALRAVAGLDVPCLEVWVGGRDCDDLDEEGGREAGEGAQGRFFEDKTAVVVVGRRGSRGALRDVVDAAEGSDRSDGARRSDVVAREASMLEGRRFLLLGCAGSLKVLIKGLCAPEGGAVVGGRCIGELVSIR